MKFVFDRIFLLLFLSFLSEPTAAQRDLLLNKIQAIAQSVKADVGVAVVALEDRDSVSFNGKRHYPMQSVYKFHVAMTVMHQVDQKKLSLGQNIHVTKNDLLPNTHSPLRDKYPNGAIIPLSEVLAYTVSQSDNNGCDILFRLLGGPAVVNDYIHSLGVTDVSIQTTEDEMHHDWNVQFKNWSTPIGAVQLLEILYQKKDLSKASTEFLMKILVETTTGPNKIKGLLPSGTIVAHKTGYSGANEAGVVAATNDVGIVTLPNGKHFAIAVFVSNSSEPVENLDEIIAQISGVAWDYFSKKK